MVSVAVFARYLAHVEKGLLLLQLLTFCMMALKIKSGRGLGGRAQRLPPKAWVDLDVAPLCLAVVP